MQKRRLFNRRRPLNTTFLLQNRGYYDVELMLRNRMQAASPLMQRLEQEALLSGHEGCVNGLEWSSNGRLLASVSDDCHLMLWDPFRHRRLVDMRTAHMGNIFAVKFMPLSGDRRVATGAADRKVLLHDVERGEEVWRCTCHQTRVKSLAVSPDSADMLWTSGEDGLLCQFDLRVPHTCRKDDAVLLLNLNNHAGPRTEIKCITINPRRPEMLAVGANDPYARIYDRRRISATAMRFPPAISFIYFSSTSLATADDNVPLQAATYYCPGQFRGQEAHASTLHKAITHVQFSPNGRELLVNMGAEQIYLYDLQRSAVPLLLNLPHPVEKQPKPEQPRLDAAIAVSDTVRDHKNAGNAYLKQDKYLKAIDEYNAGIRLAPHYPALYLNRATAYMRRNWYGDLYAALRDCQHALHLDPGYEKAHFRLARALHELKHTERATECLAELEQRFPAIRDNRFVRSLRLDIERRAETEAEEEAKAAAAEERMAGRDLSAKEMSWRVQAHDYGERFVGHCNTTTDIKQANFFGADGNYVVAGSDDGNFFIWDRLDNRITNIFKGDNAIVNCVQPHPTQCLLATSGIDDTIRLWSPQSIDALEAKRVTNDKRKTATGDGVNGPGLAEEATGARENEADHRVEVVDEAVLNNQHRMQADPFVMDIARMMFFHSQE